MSTPIETDVVFVGAGAGLACSPLFELGLNMI